MLLGDDRIGLGGIVGVGTGTDTSSTQCTGDFNHDIGSAVPLEGCVKGMMYPADVVRSKREVVGVINLSQAGNEVTIGKDTLGHRSHFNSIIIECKGVDIVTQRGQRERKRTDVASPVACSLNLLSRVEVLLLDIACLGVVGRGVVVAHD